MKRKNNKKMLRNAARKDSKKKIVKIPKVSKLAIKKLIVNYIPDADEFNCLLDIMINDKFLKIQGEVHAEYLVSDGVFITLSNTKVSKDISCRELYLSGKDAPYLCGAIRAYIDTIGDLWETEELYVENTPKMFVLPKKPIKDKEIQKYIVLESDLEKKINANKYTKEKYITTIDESIEYYQYILDLYRAHQKYAWDKTRAGMDGVDQSNMQLEDYLPKNKPKKRPNDTLIHGLYEINKETINFIQRRICILNKEKKKIGV
mgnify:CR=1 FL=1